MSLNAAEEFGIPKTKILIQVITWLWIFRVTEKDDLDVVQQLDILTLLKIEKI